MPAKTRTLFITFSILILLCTTSCNIQLHLTVKDQLTLPDTTVSEFLAATSEGQANVTLGLAKGHYQIPYDDKKNVVYVDVPDDTSATCLVNYTVAGATRHDDHLILTWKLKEATVAFSNKTWIKIGKTPALPFNGIHYDPSIKSTVDIALGAAIAHFILGDLFEKVTPDDAPDPLKDAVATAKNGTLDLKLATARTFKINGSSLCFGPGSTIHLGNLNYSKTDAKALFEAQLNLVKGSDIKLAGTELRPTDSGSTSVSLSGQFLRTGKITTLEVDPAPAVQALTISQTEVTTHSRADNGTTAALDIDSASIVLDKFIFTEDASAGKTTIEASSPTASLELGPQGALFTNGHTTAIVVDPSSEIAIWDLTYSTETGTAFQMSGRLGAPGHPKAVMNLSFDSSANPAIKLQGTIFNVPVDHHLPLPDSMTTELLAATSEGHLNVTLGLRQGKSQVSANHKTISLNVPSENTTATCSINYSISQAVHSNGQIALTWSLKEATLSFNNPIYINGNSLTEIHYDQNSDSSVDVALACTLAHMALAQTFSAVTPTDAAAAPASVDPVTSVADGSLSITLGEGRTVTADGSTLCFGSDCAVQLNGISYSTGTVTAACKIQLTLVNGSDLKFSGTELHPTGPGSISLSLSGKFNRDGQTSQIGLDPSAAPTFLTVSQTNITFQKPTDANVKASLDVDHAIFELAVFSLSENSGTQKISITAQAPTTSVALGAQGALFTFGDTLLQINAGALVTVSNLTYSSAEAAAAYTIQGMLGAKLIKNGETKLDLPEASLNLVYDSNATPAVRLQTTANGSFNIGADLGIHFRIENFQLTMDRSGEIAIPAFKAQADVAVDDLRDALVHALQGQPVGEIDTPFFSLYARKFRFNEISNVNLSLGFTPQPSQRVYASGNIIVHSTDVWTWSGFHWDKHEKNHQQQDVVSATVDAAVAFSIGSLGDGLHAHGGVTNFSNVRFCKVPVSKKEILLAAAVVDIVKLILGKKPLSLPKIDQTLQLLPDKLKDGQPLLAQLQVKTFTIQGANGRALLEVSGVTPPQ